MQVQQRRLMSNSGPAFSWGTLPWRRREVLTSWRRLRAKWSQQLGRCLGKLGGRLSCELEVSAVGNALLPPSAPAAAGITRVGTAVLLGTYSMGERDDFHAAAVLEQISMRLPSPSSNCRPCLLALQEHALCRQTSGLSW